MLARIDLLSTLLELVEIDRLGLIGVEQSLLLAAEPTQLGLPLLARGERVCVAGVGLPGSLLDLRGQSLKQNGRREMRLRLGEGTVADGLGAQAVTTNELSGMRSSRRTTRGANRQCSIASRTHKAASWLSTYRSKNYFEITQS